jgi:hypothetical protein
MLLNVLLWYKSSVVLVLQPSLFDAMRLLEADAGRLQTCPALQPIR